MFSVHTGFDFQRLNITAVMMKPKMLMNHHRNCDSSLITFDFSASPFSALSLCGA